MIFKHENNLEQFPELPVSNINGLRFYEAPNGNKYPSITTVLGKQPGKQKGLQAWRDRIGHEAAGIISGKAARRGTAFHNICEDYLNNQDISEHKGKNFLSWCMFGEVRDYLDKSINTIVLQETNMFSDKYKVAGRTDCIAEYDNDGLAVIDFKTTTTPKKREWIDDYLSFSITFNCVCACSQQRSLRWHRVDGRGLRNAAQGKRPANGKTNLSGQALDKARGPLAGREAAKEICLGRAQQGTHRGRCAGQDKRRSFRRLDLPSLQGRGHLGFSASQ